jgi:alpha-D-ribose 1-methylphosphonate 5-triphosphate synthase subunit PhnH
METTIDLVHDTQKTFRSITKAMSYPGRIIALEAVHKLTWTEEVPAVLLLSGPDLFGRRSEFLL